MLAKDARKLSTDVRTLFKAKELNDIIYEILEVIKMATQRGAVKTDYSLETYQDWQKSEIIASIKTKGYGLTIEDESIIIYW